LLHHNTYELFLPVSESYPTMSCGRLRQAMVTAARDISETPARADSTLLDLHEGDYTADFAERGAWVDWMSGGSRTNPVKDGLGIPVDMSFAFHSDAGTFPDDSIVGTLAIYTLLCDGKDKLPNGESRWQGRMLADFVQTQIVDDIRAKMAALREGGEAT